MNTMTEYEELDFVEKVKSMENRIDDLEKTVSSLIDDVANLLHIIECFELNTYQKKTVRLFYKQNNVK